MNSAMPILVMKAETLQSCYGLWQERHAINLQFGVLLLVVKLA
jgi:hypothetical protein